MRCNSRVHVLVDIVDVGMRCTVYRGTAVRVPVRLLLQRLTDHTFGALASQRSRSDILSKQKIFHCFMHMRAKTICGF